MSNSPREYIAEGAILIAIVIGAWFVFVDGKRTELARLETELTALNGPGHGASPEMLAALDREFAIAGQTVTQVQARNALAGDASELYDTIMSLANACHVQVHQLNPGTVRGGAGKSPDKVVRVSISLTASYSNLAKFIDELQSLDAFIRPLSMSSTPSPDRHGLCAADLDLELLSFSVQPGLTRVVTAEETPDGRP